MHTHVTKLNHYERSVHYVIDVQAFVNVCMYHGCWCFVADLSEPTLSGALVSICITFLMVFLFISELSNHLKIQTQSEMFIDELQVSMLKF